MREMRTLGLVIVCLLVAACGSTSVRNARASSTPVSTSPAAQTSAAAPTSPVAPTTPAVASPAGPPLQSCGDPASPARTYNPAAPKPQTPSPGTAGSIAGSVSFPSESLAPQLVYAVNVGGVALGGASVETIWGQGRYVIEGLVPGTYHVFSIRRGLQSPACADWGAIYSPAVACGLSIQCTDHSPLAVTVRAGQTTTGVDPQDWYSTPGDGSFQPPPVSLVPASPYQSTYGAFANARTAANDYAQGRAPGLLVADMTGCQQNRACVAVGVEVDGSGAAYFVGSAGSNGVVFHCGTYVYLAQGGWHALSWVCRPDHVFPAVGETGQVLLGIGASPTDCANIRASAGLSAKVVGCARAGTSVTLDGGPVYSPGANIDGLWWHVAGQGWIADDFLSRW